MQERDPYGSFPLHFAAMHRSNVEVNAIMLCKTVLCRLLLLLLPLLFLCSMAAAASVGVPLFGFVGILICAAHRLCYCHGWR